MIKLCQLCITRKKTGKRGHSGILYKPAFEGEFIDLFLLDKPLALMPVKKGHKLFAKWFLEHYPNSKGIVGRSINFLIYRYGKPIGIIGFASPPFGYRKFPDYFGIDMTKKEDFNRILNNNVFRVVHTERNLGTQILKLARREVKRLYKEKYGDDLIGLVTFVEPPRTGAVYKADNWEYLGMTQGVEVRRKGKNRSISELKEGKPKHIFGYKYRE